MSCGLVNTFQWFITDRRSAGADTGLWRVRGELADKGGGWDGSWWLYVFFSFITTWFELLNSPPCFALFLLCYIHIWIKDLLSLVDIIIFLQVSHWAESDKVKEVKLLYSLMRALLPVWESLVMLGPDLGGKWREGRERWDKGATQENWQGWRRHRKCQLLPLFSWSDIVWWMTGFRNTTDEHKKMCATYPCLGYGRL